MFRIFKWMWSTARSPGHVGDGVKNHGESRCSVIEYCIVMMLDSGLSILPLCLGFPLRNQSRVVPAFNASLSALFRCRFDCVALSKSLDKRYFRPLVFRLFDAFWSCFSMLPSMNQDNSMPMETRDRLDYAFCSDGTSTFICHRVGSWAKQDSPCHLQ